MLTQAREVLEDRPKSIDKLAEIATPALLVDYERLVRNLEAMSSRIASLGCALRPHMKTAKCAEIARLATRGQSGGLTVSTLQEAEYFLSHGFRDIVYAVGITPDKADRAARLVARGARLKLTLDSVEAATALGERAAVHGIGFDVLIEIDSDGHRAGVEPASAALVEVARALVAGGNRLAGVLTHAGASYDCDTPAAIVAMAEQERRAVVESAAQLSAAGFECGIVSVGSTPTASFAASLEGATEARPGNYMFKDLDMVSLGVCTRDELAASVLTTVLGHSPAKGWLIIDAGGLALSKDRGIAIRPEVTGFGLVADPAGRFHDDMLVVNVSQEHGIVAGRGARLDVARHPIGSRLRIYTNHICMTAAAYGRYHVVRGGAPVDIWERCNGW